MNRRAIRLFCILLGSYIALWLIARLAVAVFETGVFDTSLGLVLAFPLLSVYAFTSMGVPGLLEHGGLCGHGWCSPSLFGWAFIAVFWLGLVYLVSRAFARLGGTP